MLSCLIFIKYHHPSLESVFTFMCEIQDDGGFF